MIAGPDAPITSLTPNGQRKKKWVLPQDREEVHDKCINLQQTHTAA